MSVVSPCRGFGVWSLSVATAFIVVFQLLSRIAPCPQPILSSVASSSRGVVDASPLFAAQLHKQVPVRPSEVKLCVDFRPVFFVKKRKLFQKKETHVLTGWWSDVTVYRYWRFRPTSASPGFIASFFGLTAPQSSGNQVLALHQPHQPPSCPRRLLTD